MSEKFTGLLPTPRANEGGAYIDEMGNKKASGLKAIIEYGGKKNQPAPTVSNQLTLFAADSLAKY